MRSAWIIAAAVLVVPGGAGAQGMAPAPACAPGADPALPPELIGWKAPIPLVAAARKSGLKAAVLGPGIAANATLQPTSAIRYLVAPEKPGGPASFGGMFAFTVERAGTYRIALGAGAWIDVVAARQALAATGHGHGPDCSGVRKMVDFALTPGSYTLQIAGNADRVLPLMIARLR